MGIASPSPGELAPAGTQFRSDIEGLRAVAVGIVVAFHAGVPFLRGGFVGVDTFFVISGFLITTLLLKELRGSGRIDIARFYARRARRLLPASAFVLACTAAASAVLLAPVRRPEVAGDVIASSLYVINWRLASAATDYFASPDPSPVQHYWSLAIEEQFYLVWPVLLLLLTWVSVRARARVRPLLLVGGGIGIVAVASFTYGLVLTRSLPQVAYFRSTSRVWEIAVGGVVALTAPSWTRLPEVLRAVLGWVGVAAIVVAAVTFDEQTPFPGVAALVPVLGAAAVLGAGVRRPAWGVGAVLGTAPMNFVGRLSYSWYLWHWPVLVFAAAQWGELSVATTTLIALASLVPSYVMHRWLERPLHHHEKLAWPRRAAALAVVCTAVGAIAAVGLRATVQRAQVAPDAVVAGAGVLLDGRYDPARGTEWFLPDPIDAPNDLPRVNADGCLAPILGEFEPPASGCVYGDAGSETTIVLLGDSHAANWFPPIERAADEHGWRVIAQLRGGCSTSLAVVYAEIGRRYNEDCFAWLEESLQRVEAERPDVVVVANVGRNAVQILQDGEELEGEAARDAFRDGYIAAYERLVAAADHVLVMVDTPAMQRDIPSCLSQHRDDVDTCARPRSAALPDLDLFVEAAGAVQQIEVVDLNHIVCPVDPCPAVTGNALMYRDNAHLTQTYAATLFPWMVQMLAPIVEPDVVDAVS